MHQNPFYHSLNVSQNRFAFRGALVQIARCVYVTRNEDDTSMSSSRKSRSETLITLYSISNYSLLAC